MKNLIYIFLFISNYLFSQQILIDSIIVNNSYRSFVTYIPEIYTEFQPVPLVFNFHGRSSNAFQQMVYGDFRQIADTANFIIVHPQAKLGITSSNSWGLGLMSNDDIDFINELYSYLLFLYNIDTNKIYSTGMSNGGYMSYQLACHMSDKIAAVASVSGAMSTQTQLNCNPTRPTPILEIHGTADEILNYDQVLNDIEYWRAFNNCNVVPDIAVIPNTDLSDLSSVEHFVYDNCDNGVTTELYKIINGGHTWPGSNLSIGLTNADINASSEIWDFFSKYDLSETNLQLKNYKPVNQRKLLKVIDILGVESRRTNQLLFYVFDDGSVEKRIIIE